MKILVTGGAGYIGAHMVLELLESGFQPVVFDNLSSGHRELVSPKAVFVRGDLRRPADIEGVFRKHKISAVMHFAALSGVEESVRDPLGTYANNVLGGLHLLDAMRKSGVGRLIFSSTAAVYGEPRRIPVTEKDEPEPMNPYGRSKRQFEEVMEDWAEQDGFRFVSLRYFNVAGAHASAQVGEWHDPETHLLPNALRAAARSGTVTFFGSDHDTPDGTCIRDYVHVTDICRAHLLALEAVWQGTLKAETVNLGSGRGYSVREVFRTAEKATGKRLRVRQSGRRPGDPSKLVAGTAKAAKILGWKARHGLQEMAESAWRWELKRKSGAHACASS